VFTRGAYRVKKQTGDIRVAELQALLALNRLLDELTQVDRASAAVGHGLVDPHHA